MNCQQQNLLRGIKDLRLCGELTDVTLIAEDKEVHCHRCILAASSLYFRAMFRDFRESQEKIVHLYDISYEALDVAVTFMYTGEVAVSHDNVQSLLSAASILQLDTLVSYCVSHMINSIGTENCVDVYILADYQNLDALKAAAREYILDDFSQLIKRDDLMKLPIADVIKLISSDDVDVQKEELLFEFIVKWVDHDPENRKRYFVRLFSTIRPLLIDDEFIRRSIESNAYVGEYPFCRAILSTTKLCQIGMGNVDTEEGKQKLVQEFELNNTRRCGMFRKQMLIFSGGCNSGDQRAFCCFDPATGNNYSSIRHHPTFDFKFKIDFYKIVTNSNNEIYFIGGIFYENHHFEDDGLALDTVYKYNPKDRFWSACKPLKNPRCAFTACAVEERVFVFGGVLSYPNGDPVDTVEAYDPVLNLWQQMAPMPTGLMQHAATHYKDTVLLMGGKHEREEYFSMVLQYSIPRDTWRIIDTEIPHPRSECLAFTFDDKVYVLGGGTKTQNVTSVEIFNMETNKWLYGADFPDDRKFTSGSVLGGDIYICGGIRVLSRHVRHAAKARSVESKDLYRYNCKSDEWKKVSRLVQYGSNFCCTTAVINTKYLDTSDFLSEFESQQG